MLATAVIVWVSERSPQPAAPEGRAAARRPLEAPVAARDLPRGDEEVTAERARSAVEPVPAAAEPVPDPVKTGLFVRALGPNGEPVPRVALQWVHRSVLGGVGESSIRAATGDDGVADVTDEAKMLDAYFGRDARAASVAAVGVRCAMPFEGLEPLDDGTLPGVTWIETKPAPGAVLDVDVPPYAFVRFTWDPLEYPRGGPLQGLWFQVRRSDGGHLPGWRWGGPIEDGASEFTFGPVGLDWELWGWLSARGFAGRIGDATSVGPRTAGATTDAPLVIGSEQRDLVVLHGRVVLSDGTVPALRSAWLSLGPPGADVRPHHVQLDAESRFELVCSRSSVSRIITVRDEVAKTRFEGTSGVAPLASSSVVADVGQVTLLPLPNDLESTPEIALVAGRVLDESGVPIHRARVSASGYATRLGERAVAPDSYGPLGSVRTNSEGYFEIRAKVALVGNSFTLEVHKPDFQLEASRVVQVGTTDLELHLARGVDVRFQLRAPIWALVTERVSMSLGKGVRSPESDKAAGAEGDAHAMRFRGVPDGRHTFEVSVRDVDWEFHREEVTVAGADVTLGLVDLTSALRLCPLTLLDASGQPITSGYAALSTIGPDGIRDRSLGDERVGDGGHVTFIVPAEATGLRISHRTAGSAQVPTSAIVAPAADGIVARTKVILGP